jgi:hypothetical protein
MLLIGLLAVALVCLVLGLIMASGIWLVASLVASAAAGYLLWRQREQIAARTGVHKNQAAPKTSPPGAKSASAAPEPNAPASQAPATGNQEQQVWVVDTMPQFHAENCAAILNLDSEAIPLAQAVEDGFTECTVCKPGPSANSAEQVWVVDGRPDYHVEDCSSLKNAASQQSKQPDQIPRGQAVDDGFSACPDCRPDGAAPADADPKTDTPAAGTPAGGSGPKTVWVVDGRPRYHLSDCMIIKDQRAEEIPLDQATEDGFMACSMCEPNAARV